MSSYKSLWSRDLNGEQLKVAFTSFDGRATRREYWEAALMVIAVAFVAGLAFCFAAAVESGFFMFLSGAVVLCACIAMIPVSVRRLHDRNMPGWWIAVFYVCGLIPGINFISCIAQIVILGCLDGIPGNNRFGDDPKDREVSNVLRSNPSHIDIETRLQKLTSLRDSGVITEIEYLEQRAKILSQI